MENTCTLLVFFTDEILRYDSTTGNFKDNIVSPHDGEITDPKYAIFGPDGNLYVSSDDRILRFDGESGIFLNDFVTKGSGGIKLANGINIWP